MRLKEPEKDGLFSNCFVVPVYLSDAGTYMKPWALSCRAFYYSRAGRDFRDALAVPFHSTDRV